MSLTSSGIGVSTPGFSLAIAFEALHSRLAVGVRTESSSSEQTGFIALEKQVKEVQDEVRVWKANVSEQLERYERRKKEEFEKLREETANQVRLARQQAEQQVECVTKLHATNVQELYDLFMQMQQQQPLTEELVNSIQSRTNRQLRHVIDSQQQQIQQLQASHFLSHLQEQSLEQDAAGLKLALMEKEDMLASLASEFEGLISKLHGYIDAREHLLTMTVKEKTGDAYQQLELSLRNEQRENAWMKRALQENKRKRADRLSRLQQQVADLTQALAERDDLINMLGLSGMRRDHAWQQQPAERLDNNNLLRI